MARIRTIKPDFWQDYRLATDLTRDQRLFYIGLWNEADDEGRFRAHPARLLGSIFPYDDDLDAGFVVDTLRRLQQTGRLVQYVDGEPFGQLTKFPDHQTINRPTPSLIPKPENDLCDTHGAITDQSGSPHGSNTPGKERKGKERNSTAALRPAEFALFWSMYPKRGGSNPKPSAIRAWNARIRQGVSPSDLVSGLRRYVQYCVTTELIGSQFVLQAATFLGPSRRWEEAWEAPPGKGNGKQSFRGYD